MSYTIQIAEYQRKIIEIALRNLTFEAVNEIRLDCCETDHPSAVHVLATMIKELPAQEEETPGTVHGLCL